MPASDIHRNVGAADVIQQEKGAIRSLSGREVYPKDFYPVFLNSIHGLLEVVDLQEKRIRGLEKKLGLRESS